MLEQIETFLKTNGLAAGGLFVLVSGSILGLLWRVWGYLVTAFNKLFFVEVKVVSGDSPFWVIKHWLHDTTYAKKYCSNLLISNYSEEVDIYQPSYGRHVFIHNKRLYILNYYIEETKGATRTEAISLSAFCLFGKKKVAKDIIEEGKKLRDKKVYKGTTIYTACGDWWDKHIVRKGCFEPILQDNKYEYLGKSITRFVSNEEWYKDKGINYKFGCLLYGPPGNGKTSAILSIAQKFEKDLYIMNLSDEKLTEKEFLGLLSKVPKNAFLCIEDIDAIGTSKSRSGPKKAKIKRIDENDELSGIRFEGISGDGTESNISLSTMLNAFDGLYTPHGLIFFMTTNHIEHLDPALIRQGRVDLKLELENASKEQADALYNKYFNSQNEIFTKWAIGKSMSTVHGKLIEFKDDYDGLIQEISQNMA